MDNFVKTFKNFDIDSVVNKVNYIGGFEYMCSPIVKKKDGITKDKFVTELTLIDFYFKSFRKDIIFKLQFLEDNSKEQEEGKIDGCSNKWNLTMYFNIKDDIGEKIPFIYDVPFQLKQLFPDYKLYENKVEFNNHINQFNLNDLNDVLILIKKNIVHSVFTSNRFRDIEFNVSELLPQNTFEINQEFIEIYWRRFHEPFGKYFSKWTGINIKEKPENNI